MKVSMCATGDNMHLCPFPKEYDFRGIAGVIKTQNIRITNLESVVSDWGCCASTYCGGQWINTTPNILDDFELWGNFNIISAANNHSMDYSYDGLESTIRELDKRNWVYAGIGDNLKNASRASVLEVANSDGETVKVALISVTSTFIDAARAGNAKGVIPGRPGVNPLRIKTKYYVSLDHFTALQEIAKATYINGERDNARVIGSLPPEDPDTINFGGILFSLDSNERKETVCDDRDLTRILKEIEKARALADYVVVSLHAHQIRRGEYFEPDYFQEEFAHKCIDVGASAIIGGGTHQLKPVEIYKGKPIFYSLGNFCFQSGLVSNLPFDFWDKYRFPEDTTVEEAKNLKTHNGTVGLEYHRENYLSIIPIFSFEDDNLSDLKLIPIELGYYLERSQKGLPHLADDTVCEEICEILNRLSAPYGTIMQLKDRIIRVKINDN